MRHIVIRTKKNIFKRMNHLDRISCHHLRTHSPTNLVNVDCSLGWPLIRMSPVVVPPVLRPARTSSRVVFPAPEEPISAVILATPEEDGERKKDSITGEAQGTSETEARRWLPGTFPYKLVEQRSSEAWYSAAFPFVRRESIKTHARGIPCRYVPKSLGFEYSSAGRPCGWKTRPKTNPTTKLDQIHQNTCLRGPDEQVAASRDTFGYVSPVVFVQ